MKRDKFSENQIFLRRNLPSFELFVNLAETIWKSIFKLNSAEALIYHVTIRVMNKFVVFIFIIAMTGTGCKCLRRSTLPDDAGRSSARIWVNPVINLVQHPQIAQFEHQGEMHQENETVMSQLQGFCDRMNEKFSESGLNTDEAAMIYAGLFQGGFIRNEEVGMPDPDNPLEPESFEDFKSRVAIMVNPQGGYFIFFRRSGCGFSYVFGTLTVEKDTGTIVILPAEVWHTAVPC